MNAKWWRSLDANPGARDAAVAGVWGVVGLLLWFAGVRELWGSLRAVEAPPWVFLVTLAVVVAALTQRSQRPCLALAVGTAAALADFTFGASLGVLLGLTDLIYAAMRYGSARGVRIVIRTAAWITAACGLALLLSLIPGSPVPPWHPYAAVAAAQLALILLVPGLWGWNVRSEGQRTRALLVAEHARDTKQLRDRIAHELHDLVANQIAVSGLHVEAAKLQADRLGGDSGALMRSLERAKRGSEAAHLELRSLIAVLTAVDELSDPAPVRPAADLARLAELLPAGRALAWGPGARELLIAELAAHDQRARVVLRVLGELIANAVRHGAGNVTVSAVLDTAADRLNASVRNASGSGSPSAGPGTQGGGIGIGGARLLLAGIGGELESGRDADGWAATLSVPAVRRED